MTPASRNSRRRARPLLGTFVEIATEGTDAAATEAAIDAAFAAIARVHALMSFHEATSDVARLNREAAARPVAVDRWTYEVLAAAADFHRASDGLFDIAVAREMRPPKGGRSAHAAIALLPGHRVRFQGDVAIDLGGIAKGFAVDRAVDVLKAHGVAQGLVNAGGDLAAFGPAPRRIAIRDPRAPRRFLCEIMLADAAVATSGGRFDPMTGAAPAPAAIVDPRRGRDATLALGASVRAHSAMTADALTKVAMLAGPAALPVLRRFGAEALLVTADEACLMTRGWRDALAHAA